MEMNKLMAVAAICIAVAEPCICAGDMELWYRSEAKDWVEALPVGNGRLGAMAFGGVECDRLLLNEDTIWAGAPIEDDVVIYRVCADRKGAVSFEASVKSPLDPVCAVEDGQLLVRGATGESPHIGKWGQLQEWTRDLDSPNDKHRHTSHLYALYPSSQITPETPGLFKAAKVSLEARGDESTGWSLAWRGASSTQAVWFMV